MTSQSDKALAHKLREAVAAANAAGSELVRRGYVVDFGGDRHNDSDYLRCIDVVSIEKSQTIKL